MNDDIHTSVVIEVENQEEPESQKTYQIDFESLDKQRDYVLDEVFCGENVTVYALLEVPEDPVKKPKPPGNKMKHDKIRDQNNKFQHQNSLKHITEGSSVTKSNYSSFTYIPEELQGSENLHCLKHVNGDHEMLTGDNTDLRVLYSKSSVSRHVRSSKFKAISKGVNTDIVQTPKLFKKIQKIVKLNLPSAKEWRGAPEKESLASGTSPYNVVEMEPSITSLNSSKGIKKMSKNTSPDFFLVPLLMVDDQILCDLQINSKTEKTEKAQKAEKTEKTEETSNKPLVPVMFSRQTSTTDIELLKNVDAPARGEPENVEIQNDNRKKRCKSVILREIRQLQSKLTSLISIIELDEFSDTANNEVVNPTKVEAVMETPKDVTALSRNLSDKIPTVLDFYSSPASGDEGSKKSPESHTPETKITEKFQDQIHQEINLKATKSVSNDCHSLDTAPPVAILNNTNPSMEEPKNEVTNCRVSELENRKGARLSKSATNNAADPKYLSLNGLRKSLSFDFKDDKLEFYCLKKMKNNFFKFDVKPNFWMCQKGEGNLNCKIGGEPFALPKHSQLEFFKFSQELETLKLSSPNLESNIPFQEQEGDAKSVFSKQTILSQMIARIPDVEVHFCNTNSEFPENNIENEKMDIEIPVKSKPTYDAINEAPKTTGEPEKPATPNRTTRKGTPPLKKDIKPVKKPTNIPGKGKVTEKTTKAEIQQESLKHKPIAGSRKFTLRGTAESKLHVDKLVKQYVFNNKINEKTTPKNRSSSQKRESPEVVNDDETKEKPEKLTQKLSPDEIRKKETKKPSDGTEKTKEEPEKLEKLDKPEKLEKPEKPEKLDKPEKLEKPSQQPLKPPDSKVLVELFSKSPVKNDSSIIKLSENLKSIEENPEVEEVKKDTQSIDKVGVKSVWALTKLLLFEDGSKKIEILEASLTPPEHLATKNSRIN